jgi:hypothetical protein
MRLAFGLPLVAVFLSFANASFADEKAECLAAASRGQTLRDAHSLVEARVQFQACARRECPAIVQTDCGAWLDAVERTLPSVVLSAKDAEGHDVLEAKVDIDGKPLVPRLDGHAVAVNPGLHSFRFEQADGTSATTQVLVKEGKTQGVEVVLKPAPVVVKAPVPTAETAPVPAEETVMPVASHRGSTQRALGLVLGGLGIVGMGVGVGVALDAKSKDNTAGNENGTQAGATISKSAVNEGNGGTYVFVAGAVVAAAGVVVWLTAPSGRVAVGMDGSEVLLRGVF